MRKILFLLGSALLAAVSLSAQDAVKPASSLQYMRGYRANVELSCGIAQQWGISTSHGFSFGNGLYVGGGTGFAAEFVPDYKSKPSFLVPVFADIKFDFIDKAVTPFVGFRAGELIDLTDSEGRWFISPCAGVDISRFSISVGYEFQQTFAGFRLGNVFQCAKISFGITF